MKIFLALEVFTVANASGKITEIQRNLNGDWIEQFRQTNSRIKRGDGGIKNGMNGFKPLAAMIMYMQDELNTDEDPQQNSAQFEDKLQEFEDRYTNYGCYCWIDGVDSGVLGGGKARDKTDKACKELYKCYKCLKLDYGADYTDINYAVDFTTIINENGKKKRHLECTNNSKTDGEHICECDKKFAESLASAEKNCDENAPKNDKFENCMDHSKYSNLDGIFDGHSPEQCEKSFQNETKDHCCGLYPERFPYDSSVSECCQENITNENGVQSHTFTIYDPIGQCFSEGGKTVQSEPGNPHSYLVHSD